MKCIPALLLLAVNLMICANVFAQDSINYHLSTDSTVNAKASFRRTYFATRTATKPRIDGKLTDEYLSQGEWSGGFYSTTAAPGKSAFAADRDKNIV